jgi:hypothetical protein
MAIKTFTAGSVLTAADTNTYLTNSGLVYVASATIGSAVSSVTLSSCFNSTFTAYKIVVAGGTTSADAQLYLKLGASATGYYAIKAFYVYSSGSSFTGTDNNAAQWTTTGFSINGQGMSACIELQNPFLAAYTYMSASAAATTIGGQVTGVHQVATSYSALTITPSAGTMTGGTVTVYGYRLG